MDAGLSYFRGFPFEPQDGFRRTDARVTPQTAQTAHGDAGQSARVFAASKSLCSWASGSFVSSETATIAMQETKNAGSSS